MSEFGLIQVYTGNGKGKTTAALGLGLRAVGHGNKVFVVQFLKGRQNTGELTSTQNFGDSFVVEQYGSARFLRERQPTAFEYDLSKRGLERIKEILGSGQYNLIILDELSHGINKGLLGLEDVLSLLRDRPRNVEFILTGSNMPEEILNIADLVSEIVEVKHPYRQGIRARKGIEW